MTTTACDHFKEEPGGEKTAWAGPAPVGDVRPLPFLPRQRVSSLPRPRSTFKLVRNPAARLLHPAGSLAEGVEAKHTGNVTQLALQLKALVPRERERTQYETAQGT